MITRDEIEQKSNEFQIHEAHVERDYVNGWFLAGIFSASFLKDIFVLKGGNCLRKAYFPDTRFTVDLDFSVSSAIDVNIVTGEFNNICDFIQDNTGIIFDKNRNFVKEKMAIDEDRKIYESRIYFKDFYGNSDELVICIRIDITEFDKIYLPVIERPLIHPYSDAKQCQYTIKCVQIEEVLATKLKCLLQRRHSADLYDFVHANFFKHGNNINTGTLVSVFLKRTIFEPSPGVVKGLLLGLPFEIFRILWDKYIICPVNGVIDFDKAIETFKISIDTLFGHFPITHTARRYYPAEYRNLIFDGASSRTLIKLTYDHYERFVEPYSLAYKRRKDGVAQEYFYAYDRTGGRSRRAGIKAFLNENVQSINSTNEKFEPQFPIAISKMGEKGDKAYFSAPFRGKGVLGGRSNRSTKTVSWGTKKVYVVQCPYCLREFPRSTRNMTLRKHKDNYGYQCNGRRGTYLHERY